MYQKRKERKESKVNNSESLHKTSINWLITIYLTLSTNPLFMGVPTI